jgi:hypothetical protein
MMAHICVGKLADLQPRTVLATAPTNTAVDNNLKIFIDIAKKAGKDLQICRFRGGAPSPYMNDMRSDNATIKEALSSLQRVASNLTAQLVSLMTLRTPFGSRSMPHRRATRG